MTYTAEVLTEMLAAHLKWQSGEEGGKRFEVEPNANLRGANLSGANLSGANLRGADLRGADLRGADLSDANLSDANLSDANLRDAYLSDAYLSNANLSGAYLQVGIIVDWQNHDFIAEILRRAAGRDVQKRMVAGLILISRDWCWKEFLAIESGLRDWALDEMARWVTPDDNAPDALRTRIKTEVPTP